MADSFTSSFGLVLPEVGASLDTWGNKLNGNTAEIDKRLLPDGAIIPWYGDVLSPPDGWAVCDGTNGTPDLRDRFVVGAGQSYDLGDTGGADSVTLSTSELPSHSHSGSADTAGAHNHGGSTGGDGGHTHDASSASAGDHSHSMGSAGSHNHGGSTGNDGGHSHSASSGSAGSHSHTGSTNTTGSHTHGYVVSSGASGSNFGLDRPKRENTFDDDTKAAGNHSHSLNINSAGAHSHSISVGTVGDHNHSISSDGGHTHTVNSNGAHTHSITVDGGNHSHSISSDGDHSHTLSVDNTGGGDSHENRPPYYALVYIMLMAA